MKVVHLLNNYKWTERSEPTVDLVLAQRKWGADARLICGRAHEGLERCVASRAREKGLEAVTETGIPRHFRLFTVWRDVYELKEVLNEIRPDIIHCHMLNAHFLGSLANWKSHRIPLVRSCYHPEGPSRDIRSRFLYNKFTDGIVVLSKKAREKAIQRYGFYPGGVLIAEPGIDLDRFYCKKSRLDSRREFGLDEGSFVVGVVSRIRKTRRIDIALNAVHSLCRKFPQIRLLLVGRGTPKQVRDAVERPIRKMGIDDKVILPGYCLDERLVAAYRAMDVLVYSVPGSDRTCRTVREAMACGVPVIASRIGFLPELIDDGVDGRLMDLSSLSLAQILSEMIKDGNGLLRMGHAAFSKAKNRFPVSLQAQKTLRFYEELRARKLPGWGMKH